MIARLRLLAVLVAATSLASTPSFAHGGGPSLIFWGDFGVAAADCQRAIGTATRQCVAYLWQARIACFEELLAGTPCPASILEEAERVARGRTRQIIQRVCNDQETNLLQFNGLAETLVDSRDGCRELDTALDSAVFGPMRRAQLDVADLGCVRRAVEVATPLSRYVYLSRERILDRIARFSVTTMRKTELVSRSDEEILRAGAVAETWPAACDDAQFKRVYGRSFGAFLDTILSRADCFAGRCYAQATLICPAPTCGDGMQEPGETCDDGNTEPGDTCPANCGIVTGP